MLITMIVVGVIGYFLMPTLYSLTHASYDRRGVEEIVSANFGNNTKLTEALTEEVLITAYEYNSHEPRIFTKYTAKVQPDIYDVTLTDAAEASSSAPVYFDPKIIGD